MKQALGDPARSRRGIGWNSLTPSFGVLMVVVALAGGIFGIGGYTFTYAKGFSYLSDDPRACANCHVMRDVYEAWNHGSHKAVATCNDCHTPHEPVAHYAVKALDGWKHSRAFTTGDFQEPIRIEEFDKSIVQQNCLRCHGELAAMISYQHGADATDCLHCHWTVGHAN